MRKALIGNDVGAPILPAFILLEKKRKKKLFVLGWGVRQAGERAAEGELGKSWMLIQRLSRDYSRFAEIQLADLSRCLSALVTMPTALGNY